MQGTQGYLILGDCATEKTALISQFQAIADWLGIPMTESKEIYKTPPFLFRGAYIREIDPYCHKVPDPSFSRYDILPVFALIIVTCIILVVLTVPLKKLGII